MISRALLIGINYEKTDDELKGCINDVNNMYDLLTRHYSFEPKNILIITDKTKIKPNKDYILNAFEWLLSEEPSSNFTGVGNYKQSRLPLKLFFHYSGHGSSIKDSNKDEEDGRDETIVPLNYVKKGMISDDVIRSVLIDKINSDSRFYSLLDCCESGTNMDLKYVVSYKNSKKDININKKVQSTKSKVILFSGCKDSQSSLDSSSDGKPCGLATTSFIKILKERNYKVSLSELYDAYYTCVVNEYDKQQPVMSYGFKDDDLSRNFLD